MTADRVPGQGSQELHEPHGWDQQPQRPLPGPRHRAWKQIAQAPGRAPSGLPSTGASQQGRWTQLAAHFQPSTRQSAGSRDVWTTV